jgi:hypothetical protein
MRLFNSALNAVLIVLAFSAVTAKAETGEEIRKRAQIACVKMRATTDAQQLERTNIIIDFGIINPSLIELTRFYIEAGFTLGEDTCVKDLVEGLSSSLNK